MRIIAGRFRGQSLNSPKDDSIRPTSDRMRESLFNILSHRLRHQAIGDNDPDGPFAGLHMLDLFAGTGAFGLEALSRGAAHVTFVENAPQSLALLKSNLAKLKATAHANLLAVDATRLPKAQRPADVIFLDPPYHENLAIPALQSLQKGGWIKPSSLIIVESDGKSILPPVAGLVMDDSRAIGKSRLWFFRPEN
ncbi:MULTISPECIES: 16S rRNA (guanine(966)-N(2))-methyltransferase RsmD [unclassified Iodidimonas]|jgi:16S rRNA (guanine966-N2)-methyltransferase|uniref:16S rRNA (guanine(966)-N(2))-methyltransferase RsmD n=1 Tax=unclassified Iodidimonas TaxID=2626145 RepID=UPI002482EFEF|nr:MULTISPECIES: 16S rRNA (guanine(966)-N(2))-methyltransferase RsmD [unclassified Iodidimonas]